MELRQLRGNELDHELIWLSVTGASGMIAAIWLRLGLPLPLCPFHEITGLPCPFCGSTRCVRDLLAGHFHAAFLWNPLTFVLLFAILLFDLYALAVLLFRLPRVRFTVMQPDVTRGLRFATLALIAANWFYLVQAGR